MPTTIRARHFRQVALGLLILTHAPAAAAQAPPPAKTAQTPAAAPTSPAPALRLNVSNLLNRGNYFTSAIYDTQLYRGAPRAALLALRVRSGRGAG